MPMTTSNPDKQAFAQRLRLALTRIDKQIDSPAELALQFNLRHPRDSVTPQAAQKWLSGDSKPTPDKIKTLAEWLGVSEHWLSYGSPNNAVPVLPQGGEPISAEEIALIQNYRQLSGRQKELIAGMVDQLVLERGAKPD